MAEQCTAGQCVTGYTNGSNNTCVGDYVSLILIVTSPSCLPPFIECNYFYSVQVFLPMPCHAMPCHAMPCHAMPCHAMPCHAMPCHAMPCHAMPCHDLFSTKQVRVTVVEPSQGNFHPARRQLKSTQTNIDRRS